MHNDDFRRAIEAIKLRAPIEEVVRERVPALKKAGSLLVACCPFHEEKTPSFKVDPRRGTWHCFGSCSTGGDQIGFLERFDNLGFMDVLEILAARTGVELPRRAGAAQSAQEDEAAKRTLAALELAQSFFRAELASTEGRLAVRYLAERGLAEATSAAFGIGYAPASGQAFVQRARAADVDLAACEAAGLVRRNDQGRPYDFFRGRLTVPIRDSAGRTLGFGARRLSDDEASGPKYVNTPETALFHKGRLIYALDRALPHVRRHGHAILVEGYTDVMAAHQVGLENVVAVLGTATTDEHAALLRKSGARRVSLVFDGDQAGHKAVYKALEGLLPLDVRLDVVSIPGGEDPCDVLTRDGSAPLVAQLELARDWFEFLVDGLAGLSGVELSRAVDRVLELLARLSKPVHRESLVAELARRLDLPVASLREQAQSVLHPRRAAARATPTAHSVKPAQAQPASAPTANDPAYKRAYEQLVGALVCDSSLVPIARPFIADCPDAELSAILAALGELYADESVEIDAACLIVALEDHPAKTRIVPLCDDARAAESPRAQLEGALRLIKNRRRELEMHALERQLHERERIANSEGGALAAASDAQAIELARRLHSIAGSRHADSALTTEHRTEAHPHHG